ncbi:MAG: hypothetical protein AAFY17_00175 [Cyanobacteria bacterium J06642_11]
MGRDQIIETYIQRLLNWEKPVTADTLNSLAAEAGLGPDDIVAVKQKAQDHLDRGRNYLDFDCLDDAIDELTQAAALDPLNPEMVRDLAYAYDQRYGKQKSETDKKQAIALAKRCLDLNPRDAEPVMLISSLEHEVNSRQNYLWLGVGLVVLAIGIMPAINFFTERTRVEQLSQAALSEETAARAPETAEQTDDPTAPVPAADIPITLNHEGLKLDARQSRLDNYDESSYYTLQAVLLNTGNQEIEALKIHVDYFDQAGNAIATDTKDAIADNHAVVRPGDAHAFDLIHKTTPDLASVSLNVLTIDQLPAPDTYTSGAPIAYEWGGDQPAQMSFDLSSRSETVNSYDITDKTYFNAEWEVKNTGDRAIRRLKLQANFYSNSVNLILSEDVLVVYGSDAPMLPDEVRPVRVIKSVDKDYARYDVKVLEAE